MIDDYDPRPRLSPSRATISRRAQRLDSVGQYTNLPRTVQEKHFAANGSIVNYTYDAEVDYLQAVDEAQEASRSLNPALEAKWSGQ
jgi:hypothetical protein